MWHDTKIYELPIAQFSVALREMSVFELFSHWMKCGKQNSFAAAIQAEFKRRNILKTDIAIEA